jgi:hypothetical protein
MIRFGPKKTRLEYDLELYPVLSSIYPGMNSEVLMEMPHYLFDIYVEAMPRQLNRQQTMLNAAASYPQTTLEGRREIDNMWVKQDRVEESDDEPTEKLTKDQYFAQFSDFGLGLKVVEYTPEALQNLHNK